VRTLCILVYMTTLNVRIEEKLKKSARKTLERQGFDLSTAVKIFLNQVVIEKGLPFLPTHDPKKIQKHWDLQVKEALEKGVFYDSAKDALRDLG
jgi:DNA-damage-inducible protein J